MSPRNALLIVLAGIAVCSFPLAVSAEKKSNAAVPNVEVFYFRWDILTGSAMSASDVRDRHSVYARIEDAWMMKELRASIDGLSCSEVSDVELSTDIRLVIDFNLHPGPTESYSLDQKYLYDNGGRICDISEQLRARLRLFELGFGEPQAE